MDPLAGFPCLRFVHYLKRFGKCIFQILWATKFFVAPQIAKNSVQTSFRPIRPGILPKQICPTKLMNWVELWLPFPTCHQVIEHLQDHVGKGKRVHPWPVGAHRLVGVNTSLMDPITFVSIKFDHAHNIHEPSCQSTAWVIYNEAKKMSPGLG